MDFQCYIHAVITRNLEWTLQERLKLMPAVALLGPRQVGKTTLARRLAGTNEQSIILDLERPADIQKLSDPIQYLSRHADKCIVLDEVQRMPELFSMLRPLIDEDRRPGRFILTGSAAPELVQGISDSLAGRISYLELTPIGLSELTESISQETHWIRGGFPQALLAINGEASRLWLDDYLQSYIRHDFNELFGVAFSSVLLDRFWRMIAHNHGGVWNSEGYARSLSISAPTVMRYLEYLEGAYMVRRLLPWYVNTGKRLVRSPKVYVRDSGLLHALAGIQDLEHLFGNPLVGLSWEGYVIEQVCQVLPRSISPYFLRTHAGAEADLVLVKAEKPILCAEIKLSDSTKPSRGFYECIKTLGVPKAWCISPSSENYPIGQGVEAISLADAVREVQSL